MTKRTLGLAMVLLVGCGGAHEVRRHGDGLRAAAMTRPPAKAHDGPTMPAVARPEGTVITVSAVGDLAIGDLHYGAGAPGSYAAELAAVPDPLDYSFSKVASIFAADDLTVGNLEGTFTERAAWSNPVFSIRGKPSYAAMLPRGGVDVVNLDNNHSMDYGLEGHEDTKQALERAGVGYFGRGIVDRRTIQGIEVVNLGYLGGPSGTRDKMVADVRREKKPNNLVLVSFHWGVEAFYATHPDQITLGHAAVDAGADLVLGSHPHVLQGIESYKGRHIVYSLGNFVFGANSKPRDMDSIIYQEKFVIENGALARVEQVIIPVSISSTPDRNDFRPVVLEGDERARVLAKLEKMSTAL
jgi:poly-gamma-glutamate capsule biosynthesis protein CapA/YwtB (metallophosphatase superfamily)